MTPLMVCIPRPMTAARCSVSRRSLTRPHTTRLRSQNRSHSHTRSRSRQYVTSQQLHMRQRRLSLMHARHRDRVPGRDAYNGAVSSKSRAVHGSPRKEKKRTKTNSLIHRHSLDYGLCDWGGYAMTWGFVALMNYMTYIILHLPL